MVHLASLWFVIADEGSGGSIIPGCFAALISLGITCLAIYWVVKSKQPKPPPLAEKLNIMNGVFFGRVKNMLIGKPQSEDGHVLIVGGAGSGKSSCIAIPTLRDTWTAPALVVDIKGELLAKSKRPNAAVFNPLDPHSLGYNPFYLLKETNNPIPAIRQIALTLCPMSQEVKDPFWPQAAQNILTGHLIYCYKQGGTFTEALTTLQSTPPQVLLKLESEDEEIQPYLTQYMGLKSETLSGIMAELSNKVMVFATDRDIMAALSKSENIRPELLERGVDIFLQLPEYKLEQWRSLVTLIVQQFLQHFERRPEESATPILFLLDEFPRLGKMDAVLHGLATLRSKRITIMPMVQSLAQLDAIYGHDNRKIIADNCSYKAILKATDADTQKYFSALVGTEERVKKSYSAKELGWIDIFTDSKADSGRTVNTTTEEKAIIRPEEFAYLTDIVLLTPRGFLRVEKVPYYANLAIAPTRAAATVQPIPSYQAGYQARTATPPPIQQQTVTPTMPKVSIPPQVEQKPLPQRPRITGPLPALDAREPEQKQTVKGFVARDPRADLLHQ